MLNWAYYFNQPFSQLNVYNYGERYTLALFFSRMEMTSYVHPLVASMLCLYDDLGNDLLAIPV